MDNKSNIIIIESLFDMFLTQKGINKDRLNKCRENHYSRYLPYSENDPATWISCAFSWCMTEEGYSFWDNINEEWKNELRKLSIYSRYLHY